MTSKELTKLKPGTNIKYGMFKSVTYKGMDARHVIMEYVDGSEKKVCIELFKKHAEVI